MYSRHKTKTPPTEPDTWSIVRQDTKILCSACPTHGFRGTVVIHKPVAVMTDRHGDTKLQELVEHKTMTGRAISTVQWMSCTNTRCNMHMGFRWQAAQDAASLLSAIHKQKHASNRRPYRRKRQGRKSKR